MHPAVIINYGVLTVSEGQFLGAKNSENGNFTNQFKRDKDSQREQKMTVLMVLIPLKSVNKIGEKFRFKIRKNKNQN